MGYRTCEAIEFPNDDYVKTTPMSIGHEPVQLRPSILRPRYSLINVFPSHRPATPFAVLAQFAQLHLRRLTVVSCADSCVQRRAGYSVCGHVAPPRAIWLGLVVCSNNDKPVLVFSLRLPASALT